MADNRPIGIFDSGIGGLTIAYAINKLLPQEELIFFGDTAHLPYGDKSSHAIRNYSHTIGRYLANLGCKAIVIACNTASAVAYKTLKKELGEQLLVMNVIDPVVQLTVQHVQEGKVGVIGTKRTVRTGIYKRKLHRLNPKLEVATAATPLLAPMIEEGFFNNNISQTVINSYLEKAHMQELDALILACTHYPLIKEEISRYYAQKTLILDSTDAVAQRLQQELQKGNINGNHSNPQHRFLVSDYTKSFEETTKIFFRRKVELEEVLIWEGGADRAAAK